MISAINIIIEMRGKRTPIPKDVCFLHKYATYAASAECMAMTSPQITETIEEPKNRYEVFPNAKNGANSVFSNSGETVRYVRYATAEPTKIVSLLRYVIVVTWGVLI